MRPSFGHGGQPRFYFLRALLDAEWETRNGFHFLLIQSWRCEEAQASRSYKFQEQNQMTWVNYILLPFPLNKGSISLFLLFHDSPLFLLYVLISDPYSLQFILPFRTVVLHPSFFILASANHVRSTRLFPSTSVSQALFSWSEMFHTWHLLCTEQCHRNIAKLLPNTSTLNLAVDSTQKLFFSTHRMCQILHCSMPLTSISLEHVNYYSMSLLSSFTEWSSIPLFCCWQKGYSRVPILCCSL